MPGCSRPPVISASIRKRWRLTGVIGVMVENLLERHLAVELTIERHEDRPKPAPRVRPQHAEPLAVARRGADAVSSRAVIFGLRRSTD